MRAPLAQCLDERPVSLANSTRLNYLSPAVVSLSLSDRRGGLSWAIERFGSLLGLCLLMFTTGCQHPTRSFFPIGIYNVPKPDFPAVHQAGFNLVTGPAERSYLDSAGQLGLKVLASPGTSAGPKFDAQVARRVVGK